MSQVRVYHQRNAIPQETQHKLQRSKDEITGLTMRDINCPYCGFLVDRVFSDASGHKMVFCKKCKEEYPVNLGYFRRLKRRQRYIHAHRKRQVR